MTPSTTIVGNGTIQSQTIGQGGTLAAAALIAIGDNAGGSGTLTVLSGGTVDSGGSLGVGLGAGASGTLAIQAGGTVELTGTPSTFGVYDLEIGNGTTLGSATGSVLVSGAGALLNANGNSLQIDRYGTGTLEVTGGASAIFSEPADESTSALSVGYGGNGSVIVNGIGSTLRANGDAYFAHDGTASLTVSNGGSFFGGGKASTIDITIGLGTTLGTGGSGFALVSDDGYVNSASNFAVGYGGDTGTLDVTTGGKVEAANGIYIGQTSFLNGTLLGGYGFVDIGAGSTLQADGTDITTAGTSAISVGIGAGSTGTLDVSGSGALVTTSGNRFAIGTGTAGSGSGSGFVTISAGGTIVSGTPFPLTDAALIIGASGGTGSLTVTDSGSTYDAQGQADVGTSGAGRLLVENGGTFLAGGSTLAPANGFVVGYSTASNGAVIVTGAGSVISNVGKFVIGGNSTGTYEASQSLATGGPGSLLIEAGGLVKTSRTDMTNLSSPGADIAADPGTGGSTVTVTGANSTWQIGGPLLVGDDAAGTLTVSAGGTVSATGIDAGVAATGGGVISLTGAGSAINVSGLVTIGDASSGALSIGNGAKLTAGTLTVGLADSVALLGGWLDVLGSITNSGTISAAGSLAELSGAISGTGALSIGAGADLQLDNAVGSGQTLTFGGAGATLAIAQPAAFTGTIDGFASGDVIDAIGATSGTVAGNVVTLFSDSSQVGTLTFGTAVTNLTVTGGSQAVISVATVSATTTSGGSGSSSNGGGGTVASSGTSTVDAGNSGAFTVPAGVSEHVTSESNTTIIATTGAPTISASTGNPFVVGGSSSLDFIGGAGAATVLGGSAGNTVQGGSGSLLMFAGSAATYTPGAGSATIIGGSGPLTATFGAGGGDAFGGAAGGNNLAVAAGGGYSVLVGGGNGDLLTDAGAGSDILVGGGGAETLNASGSTGSLNAFFGGSGAESIVGGSGQGFFVAGTGNETLTGASGLNEFIYGAGSTARTDVITNFNGADSIGLFGYSSGAAASVVAAKVVTSAGTTLTLSDNTTIFLAGFTNISQADVLSP